MIKGFIPVYCRYEYHVGNIKHKKNPLNNLIAKCK